MELCFVLSGISVVDSEDCCADVEKSVGRSVDCNENDVVIVAVVEG